MSAKRLFVCLAIALVAVIATEVASAPGIESYANKDGNKSHHFYVGYRVAGDKLIYRENIIVDSSWLQVKSKTKTFNTTSLWEKITYVQALDQKTNGNGAYVSLISGGPGQNSVTLKFKSQRGHGINFVVELYGR
nr:probable salivary secreted peptide [Megalopta genalis]